MRLLRSLLLLGAASCVLSIAPAAKAGPNVPLCLTIENSYNACLQQQNRRWGVGRGGYGGYGGYDGYGGYGGYGGDWDGDDDPWRQQGRQARANRAAAACAPFIAQLKAYGCF